MPRIIAALALAALAAVRSSAAAQETSPSTSRRLDASAYVRSFDSAGRSWRRYVSQRFDHVTVYATRRGQDHDVVIRATTTRTCCLGGGANVDDWVTLALAVFHDTAGSFRGPEWTRTLTADRGELIQPFYRATQYGAGDGADELDFLSLRSGKTVFTASTPSNSEDGNDLASIDVPNGYTQRFAAFHDAYAPVDPPEAARYPDLIGILQYGPAEGPAARYVVRCTDSKPTDYRYFSLAFRIKGEDSRVAHLWSSDFDSTERGYRDFEIHLQLEAVAAEGKVSFVIPVEADTLVVGRATIPEPCHVQRVVR